jgi:hypothetical protein
MSFSLTPTYKIVSPPEAAMKWETYEPIIKNEWTALLARGDTTERDFQEFFERHPCCLPQMYPLFQRGGHGPYPGAIVSQPSLPGLSRKIPDFLYITRDSTCVYAVLIEIEHPSKPWATSSGQSSAEFTQATNQISEWKAWFNDPLNVAQFQAAYRIPTDWLRSRAFSQKYILIYGRRADPTLTEAFNKKRRHLEREDEVYMTYDRIKPDPDASQCISVTIDGEGYRALRYHPR